MTLSRRELLAVPAVTALAVLAGCSRNGRPAVVDVRSFGARGDGITDDSEAIQSAASALRTKGTLRFPRGVYRFAKRWPPGGAAIVISGLSDVGVEFDPGAELFLDNLDPTERTGSSHGVLIRGPASRISLQNVNVRWADGAKRSLGDGIRIEGFPADTQLSGWTGPATPVDAVTVSGCTVRSSPQTGVVMLGVSGIEVTGLRVTDSGADGLHFNACQHATVDEYNAVNTGDDGLALVTYFAPQPAFDEASHTFSFPDLTEWSNQDFAVSNVNVFGCRANGVRLAGAHQVAIDGLDVVGVHSGSAFLIDSAEPGADVGWNYVASRAVRLGDVTATDCDMGIHLLARPGASGDQRFTDFDVHVDDAKLDECATWSVRAESLTERQTNGLRIDNCSITASSTAGGNGGVGIANATGITFGDMSIRHPEPVVVFSAVNAGELTIDHLSVAITRPDQPDVAAKDVVAVDHSDGVIKELTIGWPAAPSSWIPVRVSPALTVPSLTVTPPVVTSSVQRP
ncbi:glycosyl hydrolase family 28-related protein [Mycolicibacterium baixiangningiae]|uniref:glycosyl hydrolase family 28-related protein n=1 Tax=Mycolicibacterium baixiangningiae TaxID=2761578 RepID=UPI0018D09D69|nr:glycosyl hydrolase family 28-related protein [Mycolicibacterium baixiangningiae]